MREVGNKIAALDNDLREVDEQLQTKMSWLPNLPHESVPVGKDESDNQFVREWGKKPQKDFKVLPHWEIGSKLGILDLDGACRISGSGFYMLRGLGARLVRALINYMLDTHTADGFQEVLPPVLVNSDTMFGTGQLPQDGRGHVSYRRRRSLSDPDRGSAVDQHTSRPDPRRRRIADEYGGLHPLLPSRGRGGRQGYPRHAPCPSVREGRVGQDRAAETSYDELEVLLAQAEKILQGLNIPYRVMLLATGDLSFASAKTLDLELWAAGVDKYLEISSVSNFEDFQARRMNCRFRDAEKKMVFPHTLNGSGLALARLVPAILENYQNADGTVTIPDALRPYMGGVDRIG